MRKFLNLFDFKQKVDYKIEVLSGLTVALALIPEAVAFALIAGLSPLTGLYAAFVMGIVTSIFGGRPGMISGATGAIAVIIVELALSYGSGICICNSNNCRNNSNTRRHFKIRKTHEIGTTSGNFRLC